MQIDPDPELDQALGPLRSLLLTSENGEKRRRLGSILSEAVEWQLRSGVPDMQILERVIRQIESWHND